ncbi:MAG: 50S ribosomal protein L2 [Candidatus Methanomethylophilaceae archaeon]|jgi:large subunit ribosomal protein L2|nr:50S ribosomal protein L2 [Methanomassiliicoccales archaeon RumEn M2]MDD2532733.1 50S ribosomal protein L2 [Candidatus Methanomethylophilaceae archaeon]MDI9378418.1 50S ribosomal protein L2 [Candidatus Thermoplasmatota archaeon]
MGKRLRTQRRGRGTPRYRSPSHRHVDDVRLPAFAEGAGTITDLIHAPGRTSPLAVVDFGGDVDYQLAAEGMSVGQTIDVGSGKVSIGNIMKLSEIPEGTAVHNIEKSPGDGGKFVKVAGVSAQVISRGNIVVLQMPSGELKDFNPDCRAAIGVVAGGGRTDKPLAKAGKKYHALRSSSKDNFHVSGVAMNPVDHPHGGGSHPHVGGPSTVSRNAWPGQKVGRLSPQKKKKKR